MKVRPHGAKERPHGGPDTAHGVKNRRSKGQILRTERKTGARTIKSSARRVKPVKGSVGWSHGRESTPHGRERRSHGRADTAHGSDGGWLVGIFRRAGAARWLSPRPQRVRRRPEAKVLPFTRRGEQGQAAGGASWLGALGGAAMGRIVKLVSRLGRARPCLGTRELAVGITIP